MAFEMANQLKEAGVVVKGLILIDSPFPVNHQPLPKQISSAVVEGIYSRLDHKTKSKTSKAFERHASMLATYTPPTHCSPVTVALKSNESIPTEEKYGVDYPWLSKQDVRAEALDLWSTLVGGRLETLDVSGNHFQALDPDNVSIRIPKWTSGIILDSSGFRCLDPADTHSRSYTRVHNLPWHVI